MSRRALRWAFSAVLVPLVSVLSGFLVGGKDSKIPNSASDIAKWLRAHVTSFCLDGKKLDEKKLTEANKGRDGQQ